YYLGINTRSLGANCWRCGPHPIKEILQSLGASKQALARLFRGMHDAPERPTDRRKATGQYRPPRSVPLHEAPPVFRKYLKRRNLNPEEVAELWGVQAIPPPTKYNWRLFITVVYHGRAISWTTRSIDPDCPHSLRYLSSPPERELQPIQSVVYGKDYCQHAIIVVEGPVDAWRIGPGAVATFGLTLSSSQISQIA